MRTRVILTFVVLCVASLPTTSCGHPERVSTDAYARDCPTATCVRIVGKLTEEHVKAIQKREQTLDRVVVESVGGRTGYAYEIAKIIYRRNADLVIENECSSACFEFFVPVARTVVAIGDPVIAVHGNPVMLSLLLEKDGYEYKTNCRWEALEFLDTVYASKGLNKGYHAKALSMLGEVDVEYSLKTDGCLDSFEMNSEIKFWEPTSDEIERFLGVEIIGEICRDSIGSCI